MSLVALGLTSALVLLELGLRLGAAVYIWNQGRENRRAQHGSDVTILCIGESTTALGGDDAYPAQLQRLLNAEPSRPKVSVLNRGVPGVNTDFLLERLPQWLGEYRPDVVVAMMGANDAAWAAPPPPATGPIRRWVDELRLTKVVRYVWESLRVALGWRTTAPPIGNAMPNPDEAELARRLADHPDDVAARVRFGQRLLDGGHLEEAREQFERAVAQHPQDAEARLGLARIDQAQGNLTSARTRLAALDAEGARDPHSRLVATIGFYVLGDVDRAQAIAQEVAASTPQDPTFREVEYLLYLGVERDVRENRLSDAERALAFVAVLPGRHEERYQTHAALLAQARGDTAGFETHLRRAQEAGPQITAMTAHNYRTLRALLHEHGIPLVAVQYPLRDPGPLRVLLDLDPAVTFVDNQTPFRTALRTARYDELFTDVFAGDFGHATARGNRLLAETVAQAIRPLLEARSASRGLEAPRAPSP